MIVARLGTISHQQLLKENVSTGRWKRFDLCSFRPFITVSGSGVEFCFLQPSPWIPSAAPWPNGGCICIPVAFCLFFQSVSV